MFSQPRKPHSLWPSKSLTTHHDHLNGREKNFGATELRCFVSGSRSEPLNLKVWRFEVSRIEFNHRVGWTYAQVKLDDFFQFSGAPIPKVSETTIYRSVRFRESLKLISARIKMRNGLKHWNHHTIPIVPIRDPLDPLDRPLFFDARDSSVKRLELIQRIPCKKKQTRGWLDHRLSIGKNIRKNRELLSIRWHCYCNPLDGF